MCMPSGRTRRRSTGTTALTPMSRGKLRGVLMTPTEVLVAAVRLPTPSRKADACERAVAGHGIVGGRRMNTNVTHDAPRSWPHRRTNFEFASIRFRRWTVRMGLDATNSTPPATGEWLATKYCQSCRRCRVSPHCSCAAARGRQPEIFKHWLPTTSVPVHCWVKLAQVSCFAEFCSPQRSECPINFVACDAWICSPIGRWRAAALAGVPRSGLALSPLRPLAVFALFNRQSPSATLRSPPRPGFWASQICRFACLCLVMSGHACS
jgi:hypothetical protein